MVYVQSDEEIVLTVDTSYTLWKYCMKYPDVRDICDVAAHLFPRYPRVAYEATAIMLLLSNIFLIGFHVFTSAKSEPPNDLR